VAEMDVGRVVCGLVPLGRFFRVGYVGAAGLKSCCGVGTAGGTAAARVRSAVGMGTVDGSTATGVRALVAETGLVPAGDASNS